jgi:acetyltransferase-like isoleucine patch superfamily enzyme
MLKAFKIDSEKTIQAIRNRGAIVEAPCRISKMVRFEVGRFGAFSFCRGGDFSKVKSVGRFCSIAWDVTLGAEEHRISMLTTGTFLNSNWDFEALSDYYARNSEERAEFLSAIRSNRARNSQSVVIGSDVWIGKGAVIRRGVTVGDGAVIGANSVVSTDVPPYTVVTGIPAEPLRTRFSRETVSNLMVAKWWDMSLESLDGIPWARPDEASIELRKRRESGNFTEAVYPVL